VIDIEEIRALVRPDGSDFKLVAVEGDKVHLSLLIDDASCAECVMPRPILEEIALGILRRSAPDVRQVVIDDPRETTA
jgi:NifU-like domain